MKVYLVEDAPEVRDRLVEMLGDIPRVEVVGVADAAPDALSGIVRLQPDVVVLDIRLRSGNGIEVLKEIRKWVPGMTVIMLTNYASPALRARCLAAGADYFLDKTAEFERVRTVLEQPAITAAVRISCAKATIKRSRPMCGTACPLLEDEMLGDDGWRQAAVVPAAAVRDFRHEAALAIIDGRVAETCCPDLHGIVVLDAGGVIQSCTDGAARALGEDRACLAGRAISTLIPDLRLHAGTPGYNVAYALFWFPSHEWREALALTGDGRPLPVDLSISAAQIKGRHRLLVALRHAPRAAAGVERVGGCADRCESTA